MLIILICVKFVFNLNFSFNVLLIFFCILLKFCSKEWCSIGRMLAATGTILIMVKILPEEIIQSYFKVMIICGGGNRCGPMC